MRTRHLASALVAAVGGGLFAVACVQSAPIDAPRVETTDDDGDFGGDPDVGGSVGSDPVAGGGFSSDPAVGGSIGSDPDVGGGIGSDPDDGDGIGSESPPSGPVTAPSGGQNPYYLGPIGHGALDSCAEKCSRSFEADASKCLRRATEEQRRACQHDALASYENCQGSCGRKGDPCVEDCEWEKKDCDNQRRKIPEKKKREREACWAKCEREYADCLKKCND